MCAWTRGKVNEHLTPRSHTHQDHAEYRLFPPKWIVDKLFAAGRKAVKQHRAKEREREGVQHNKKCHSEEINSFLFCFGTACTHENFSSFLFIYFFLGLLIVLAMEYKVKCERCGKGISKRLSKDNISKVESYLKAMKGKLKQKREYRISAYDKETKHWKYTCFFMFGYVKIVIPRREPGFDKIYLYFTMNMDKSIPMIKNNGKASKRQKLYELTLNHKHVRTIEGEEKETVSQGEINKENVETLEACEILKELDKDGVSEALYVQNPGSIERNIVLSLFHYVHKKTNAFLKIEKANRDQFESST